MALLTSGLALVLFLLPRAIYGQSEGSTDEEGGFLDIWIVRLTLNLLGYATIFVPGAILIQHLRKSKYNETAGPGCMSNLLVLCVFGREKDTSSLAEEGVGGAPSQTLSAEKKMEAQPLAKRVVILTVCFLGLQASYLTWGLLQERIMTFEYGRTPTSPGEKFQNSQFLVFVNRILAFAIALLVIMFQHQPNHTAPLYKYSFSSFSNIMSSWFQYEALKFVSFPTQVLAKASKVIPVMLMGKIVSKRSYEFYEYLTAVMISLGVSMFLLTSQDATKHDSSVTTTSGMCLLVGYMMFDSFTSNWQGELFSQYKMSSIQMMAGVNLFSCLLTSVSLVEQGGFFESSAFMLRHPDFMVHSVILSVCSATGQLFIFYTIARFGAVSFIIIMTMRQGFAILLSCIIYGHPVTVMGFLGIMVVFAALFIRIYASQRKKALKPPPPTTTTTTTTGSGGGSPTRT